MLKSSLCYYSDIYIYLLKELEQSHIAAADNPNNLHK